MGFGSILSGVGSLLGAGAGIYNSLSGSNAEGGGAKKAKHHQLDYDRRRIKAITDGARDAGIHPLVALGAAGSGGFAAPVTDSGSMPSWLGPAAAGLSAFGDLYEQDADAQDRERAFAEDKSRYEDAKFQRILDDQREIGNQAKQDKLIDAQINMYNANALESQARAAAQGATTMSSSSPTQPRKINVLGTDFVLRPGASTAQEAQDVAGEPFEWGTSLDTLIYNMQLFLSAKEKELQKKYGKRFSPRSGTPAPPPIY